MLTRLFIRNFGLIDEVALEFGPGLNVLTGETGAGKSILIEALRVALGGRLTATHIRDAQKPCVIEAVFDLTSAKGINFEEIGEYFEGGTADLIIQRTAAADGKTKLRINGLSATATQLKQLGRFLVDFHGAHDHQLLLSEDQHIRILDRLIDFGTTRAEYQDLYAAFEEVSRQWRELKNLAQTRERELDMLQHQVSELEQVPLEADEYERVKSDLAKIDNLERLSECLAQLLDLFENDEYGISGRIQKLFSPLRQLTETDETTAEMMDRLEEFQSRGEDLASTLNDYAQSMDFDGGTAEEVRRNADIYDEILRKYGPGIADARGFYSRAAERLRLLSDLEHNDAELRARRAELESKLKVAAKAVTKKRKAAAKDLKTTIEKELKELGIADVVFECRLSAGELNADGTDEVAFYISPNAGFEPKPLAEIVSSGEAARVMLALKKALIKVDPIPVLIFDEIDAQIGGRLGTVTGQKLRDISGRRQVILITHLPQIASFADQHYKVVKTTRNKAAITEVLPLDKTARIEELAHMMSGSEKTQISLDHARKLLVSAGRK
ncbi:MAG: DNA repair protein RecN [Candidatus Omnitrophica bacterium]|nr:DNA repair protein RecN [Candidatus Omnitrophota bacterium]